MYLAVTGTSSFTSKIRCASQNVSRWQPTLWYEGPHWNELGVALVTVFWVVQVVPLLLVWMSKSSSVAKTCQAWPAQISTRSNRAAVGQASTALVGTTPAASAATRLK